MYSLKTTVSCFVLVSFLFQIIIPSAYTQERGTLEAFDPNTYYDIVSKTNVYTAVSGSKLSWIGEKLEIQMTSGGSILIAKEGIEQIRKINEEVSPLVTPVPPKKKAKRNTLKGLAIGAGAGALVGTGVGTAIAVNCNDSDAAFDFDCGAKAIVGGIVAGSILIGGAVTGLIIGALTKKKEKQQAKAYFVDPITSTTKSNSRQAPNTSRP